MEIWQQFAELLVEKVCGGCMDCIHRIGLLPTVAFIAHSGTFLITQFTWASSRNETILDILLLTNRARHIAMTRWCVRFILLSRLATQKHGCKWIHDIDCIADGFQDYMDSESCFTHYIFLFADNPWVSGGREKRNSSDICHARMLEHRLCQWVVWLRE